MAEGELRNIRSAAAVASQELKAAAQQVEDLVLRSDQVLSDDPKATTLVGQVGQAGSEVENALRSSWPDTSTLAAELAVLGKEVTSLMLLRDWFLHCDPVQAICNRSRQESLQWDVEALGETLTAFQPGSAAQTSFADLRMHLRTWQPRLAALTTESFGIKHTVRCGYPFFETRKTTLTLTKVDRLEKDRAKGTSTVQIAEVVCPSHFSVTAGVGVANIDERDIAFKEAPATSESDDDENGLTKVFGFDYRSSEQINPTFLIHARLPRRCETMDFHVSFGTVVDFDRPDDTGVFGYLGGATLGIKDTLFMTLGLQAQRVPELAGGFKIGDPVPADLASPPLAKDWEFGPVFTVSYKMN